MPIVLTALVIYWLGSSFVRMTDFVPARILSFVFRNRTIPDALIPLFWVVLYSLIAIVFFFATVLLGAVIRRSIGRRLFDLWEKLLSKIPIIRNLYDPLKQVLSTLLGGKKDRFKGVVLIEYPRIGIYSLAFVTSEIPTSPDPERLTGRMAKSDEQLMTVFIPSSPNPTTGWMLIVPSSEVTAIDMTVEEGIKLIFSGGLVAQNPATFRELQRKVMNARSKSGSRRKRRALGGS